MRILVLMAIITLVACSAPAPATPALEPASQTPSPPPTVPPTQRGDQHGTPTPGYVSPTPSRESPPIVGTATLSDDGCVFRGAGIGPAANGFVIEVVNQTGDDAGFDLWLLHADTTFQDWVAYHADPPGPPHGIAEDIDLMEAVEAGGAGRLAARNSKPGVYALQCWRFGPQGDELMTAGPFVVASLALSGRVVLTDTTCEFEQAEETEPGQITIRLSNETSEFAGFDLFRLKPASTFAQLRDHIEQENDQISQGRPPLGHPSDLVVQMKQTGVEPAQEAELSLDAVPGTLAVVCIVAAGPTPEAFFVVGPFELGGSNARSRSASAITVSRAPANGA